MMNHLIGHLEMMQKVTKDRATMDKAQYAECKHAISAQTPHTLPPGLLPSNGHHLVQWPRQMSIRNVQTPPHRLVFVLEVESASHISILNIILTDGLKPSLDRPHQTQAYLRSLFLEPYPPSSYLASPPLQYEQFVS